MINIEIVFGLPERQWLVPLAVESCCTIEALLERLRNFAKAQELPQSGKDVDPEANGLLDLALALQENNYWSAPPKVGIFSRLVALDTGLRAGDRVELYRNLQVDAKEARRVRAQRQTLAVSRGTNLSKKPSTD